MLNREKRTLDLDGTTLEGWQCIVDLMAEICGVPAGLVMRVTGADIEVFVASQTEGNPYNVGDRETLAGSGLYCEHVIRTRSPLHVPDARADGKWYNNPDIKLGMIAYHGYPILAPSGDVVGTICVLDQKPYEFGPLYDRLIGVLKTHIEQDVRSIATAQVLQERNDELTQAMSRIKTLEGILPTCARCKKIRLQGQDDDDPNSWIPLEAYVRRHTNAQFSHGMCPICNREIYGDDAQSTPGMGEPDASGDG